MREPCGFAMLFGKIDFVSLQITRTAAAGAGFLLSAHQSEGFMVVAVLFVFVAGFSSGFLVNAEYSPKADQFVEENISSNM